MKYKKKVNLDIKTFPIDSLEFGLTRDINNSLREEIKEELKRRQLKTQQEKKWTKEEKENQKRKECLWVII